MDIFELLFLALVSPEPQPDLWPEHLRKDPFRGHGQFCFTVGLTTGLALGVEAYREDAI